MYGWISLENSLDFIFLFFGQLFAIYAKYTSIAVDAILQFVSFKKRSDPHLSGHVILELCDLDVLPAQNAFDGHANTYPGHSGVLLSKLQ